MSPEGFAHHRGLGVKPSPGTAPQGPACMCVYVCVCVCLFAILRTGLLSMLSPPRRDDVLERIGSRFPEGNICTFQTHFVTGVKPILEVKFYSLHSAK